jgi:hypothetical protein
MLHEARTGHLRPLRARANRLSRQPSTSPLPLPVWERKGARGKGGRASRAPQHRDGRRCTPLPSRKGDAYLTRQRFPNHYGADRFPISSNHSPHRRARGPRTQAGASVNHSRECCPLADPPFCLTSMRTYPKYPVAGDEGHQMLTLYQASSPTIPDHVRTPINAGHSVISG